MKPAGFENGQDIISSQYLKDPTDAQWKDDAGMKAWNEFLDKYYPEANRADASVMYGYDAQRKVKNIVIDNVTVGGRKLTAPEINVLDIGQFVEGVSFK